ncbi:MAG TPA: DUF2156 domain-containing protein [bacterium]
MIPDYPMTAEVTMDFRPILHPKFQSLREGISEFAFANIFLFRDAHNYRLSKIADSIIITGRDGDTPFFMVPFGLLDKEILNSLFHDHKNLKAATEDQAKMLAKLGYQIVEDRDNFDYLYSREELAELAGRKYHKKKNLVNAFINNYNYEGKPLLEEFIPHALEVLESWRNGRDNPGDYKASREALEMSEALQLCGGIYYVDSKPAAFTLGEELAGGESFVIHFEKALSQYKGIYQFVNQCFASILPEKYSYINREQDLGDPGLRQAKLSYRPVEFVKKYRIMK